MIRITDFELVDTYSLLLTFSDGTRKRVNLRDWLYGPVFEPLRDPDAFARVRIEAGDETISWPNGADFAPEFLYEMEPEAEPV
ncbi:MAG TPA: DUF2442 domain-containing protein [Anaerolineales bacterium]|jgi:hypothetical protein|nr:DUF2442 domain-containing protein [Anaerolineales bacterium]